MRRRQTTLALVVSLLALLACGTPPRPSTTVPAQPPKPIVVAPDRPTTPSDAATEPHRLPIFAWAMRIVRATYVDPPRLVPRQLFVAALDDVQRRMAELVVEARPDDVIVRVNDKHRIFSIADLDSDDKLVARLEEVFGFMKAHKNAESDLAKLEYGAMNGVLDSLDPHSSLLEPEDSKEMAIRLSGKFGGIGIVIGAERDKAKPRAIVVREVIAGDTPAKRAKLAVGDRIVKINEEPTQNLTVDDAISRLRGDPNTEVTLAIERGDATDQVRLVRATITVPAVSGRLVGKRVGYLKLDQFSANISVDLGRLMDDLRRKGAKSWVMDLRGNTGGFLAEAVKIVDRFVDKGIVVTSVGPAKRRDYSAGASELDDKGPLVVLIDHESASSSEIVAGALKYLDRAVLVGTTSFGKGSVQTLHDHPQGARLKLTSAQYLTAKGISIQSVGIIPDIRIDRIAVPEKLATPADVLRLVPAHRYSESDHQNHLTSAAVTTDKPKATLGYLGARGQGPATDYVMDFAVELAGNATSRARDRLVATAEKLVAQRRKIETTRIAKALGKLAIDWQRPTGPAQPAQLTATFSADQPRVRAGEIVAITGAVTNTGKTPAFQVRAQAKSDDNTFDDLELAFGRIDPGATKRVTVHVRTAKAADSRKSVLVWSFVEHASQVATQPLAIDVDGLPRPRFAFSYHVADDNDGLAQPAEKMRLRVRVRNVGPGRAPAALVTLKSLVADRILVDKGHAELGALEPGQTRDVELAFAIRNHLDISKLELELAIADTDLDEEVEEKIVLRVKSAVAIAPSKGAVSIVETTPLWMGAAGDAGSLGTVPRGTTLTVTGRSPAWTRVELAPGRPAFVATSAVSPAKTAPVAFEPRWQVTPPQLAVVEPVRETSTDHVRLTGTAQDDTKLDDLYIIVYNRTAKQRRRKVFYLSNRGGTPTAQVPFSTDIPLSQGSNAITVIARESSKIRTVHTFWVNRQ